jgi:hypothetical protein
LDYVANLLNKKTRKYIKAPTNFHSSQDYFSSPSIFSGLHLHLQLQEEHQNENKNNVTFEIKHVTSYRQNTGQHTEELVGFPRKTDKGSILR